MKGVEINQVNLEGVGGMCVRCPTQTQTYLTHSCSCQKI